MTFLAAGAAGAAGADALGASGAGATGATPDYAGKASSLLGANKSDDSASDKSVPLVAQVPAVPAPTPFRAQVIDHVSNYIAGRLAGLQALNNSGNQ